MIALLRCLWFLLLIFRIYGQPYTLQQWFCALQKTEVGGVTSGPWPVGDSGKARGPYQIWFPYWIDALRKPPNTLPNAQNIKQYKQDAENKDTAKQLVNKYMKRYCSDSYSNAMSLEQIKKCARIHNGGPNGYKRDSTLKYWAKFKTNLDSCSSSPKPSHKTSGSLDRLSSILKLNIGGLLERFSEWTGIDNIQSGSDTKGCGSFPSGIELRAITDESVISGFSEYNDPNGMGICLFKLNDEPNHNENTRISTHFKLKEFASKDGAQYIRLSPILIECLELIRNDINKPLTINSGYRTVTHNKNEGGKPLSYHLSGTSSDIRKPLNVDILSMANSAICRCRKLFKRKGYDIGLGLANNYLHIDLRKHYAFWIYNGVSKTRKEWGQYINDKYKQCGSYNIEPQHKTEQQSISSNTMPDKYNDIVVEYAVGVRSKEVNANLVSAFKHIINGAKKICGNTFNKVYISSLNDGKHSTNSNHYRDKAFDLSRIDGKRMSEYYEKDRVVKCVTDALQESAETFDDIRENFGPKLKLKLHKTAKVGGHKDHIHISVNG